MQDSPSSPPGLLPRSIKLRALIFAALALMAAVSSYVGITEALTRGIDFQWSAAHLLAEHKDPWNIFIRGDPQREIILGQQPNYLPEFYLLLEPLGKLPFEQARAWWCFFNLVFLVATVGILRKLFRLDRDHTLLVALLSLSGMPFRVTLANGQHGLFILFLLCVLFYSSNRWVKGLSLGLSYSKYSFSPLIAVLMVMKKRLDVLLISILPPILGLFVVWRMLSADLPLLTIEPLLTSRIAMGPGTGDIMTLLEQALRMWGVRPDLVYLLPTLLGLIAGTAAAAWIASRRRVEERMQLALSLIMTLLCFKHVNYDFVVLIVPLAAAVTAPRSRAQLIVLACIGFFWFLLSVLNRLYPGVNLPKTLTCAIVLSAMAIATSRLTVPLTVMERHVEHAPQQ